MEKIFVIGAGSWGTALAALLGEKGYSVHLWARRKELAEEVNKTRENKQYLKGIKIPETVTATNSIERVSDSNVVVIAVPSKFFRETIKQFSSHISNDSIVVHTIKGFEGATGRRISDVLSQELPAIKKVAVMSGPNHSKEVARKIPTATVIASHNKEVRDQLCKIFSTPYFKPYPHDDVIGVEICGAIKNIVAMAIGVCDGLKLGDNSKGSIITLGLTEMSAIAKISGAKRMTCYGLAGVGDLVATCYSRHSRNRFVGEMLAKGKGIDEIKKEMRGMVAEGLDNAKIAYDICRRNKINAPLIHHSYKVLHENMDIKQAVAQLLNAL
ncbi:MAG: NAD(P)H-dependent glycerol-3-phosphate dehydrogenase [Nanoarchaeota archaeon]